MANPRRKRGPALLKVFLAASRQSQADAARAVDVSSVTVHHWLNERISPRAERRAAFEEWTRGAVPAVSWDEDASPAEIALADAAGSREAVENLTPTPIEGAA